MEPLLIKKILTEENKLNEISFAGKKAYSMYKGLGDDFDTYYLADKDDPEKIYMMVKRELWNDIFNKDV